MKRSLAALAIMVLGVGCKEKERPEMNSTPGTSGAMSGSAAMGSAMTGKDMGNWQGSGSAGSGSGSAAAEPKPMTAEELAKRYEECWAFWNAGKFEDVKSCYAYDAVLQLPGARVQYPTLKGASTIANEFAAQRPGFPDLKGEPQLVIVNDRDVIGVVLVTGTHDGVVGAGRESTGFDNPLAGIPASKKKVGYLLAQVVAFDAANKLSSEYDFFDLATILGQIVASKNPARPALDKGWPAKVTGITKGDDAETANTAVVDKLVAAMNKHDNKGVGDVLADDVVWSDQTQPADWDKKAVATNLAQLWRAFSNLSWKTVTNRAAGDFVVSIQQMEGTNDGDFPAMKLKKTGKGIALPILVVHRLDKGKIKAVWVFYQRIGLGELLGVAPPAPQVPAAGSGSGSGSASSGSAGSGSAK
jgi:ketosteroid isomerase-like protein